MNEVEALPTLGIIKDVVLVAIILAAQVMALRAATLRVVTPTGARNRAASEVCGGFVLVNGVTYLDGYVGFSTLLQLAIVVIGGSQLIAAGLQYSVFLAHHKV